MDPKVPGSDDDDDWRWGGLSPGGEQGMRGEQGLNIAGAIDQPKML